MLSSIFKLLVFLIRKASKTEITIPRIYTKIIDKDVISGAAFRIFVIGSIALFTSLICSAIYACIGNDWEFMIIYILLTNLLWLIYSILYLFIYYLVLALFTE